MTKTTTFTNKINVSFETTMNRRKRRADAQTPSTKRSVAFSPEVRVKTVENWRDRRYNLWYTCEEFVEMNVETHEVVQCINGLGLRDFSDFEEVERYAADSDDVCFRGLENKTPFIARNRMRRVYKCVSAVLGEQELQRQQGIKDPERIAKAYSSCTAASVKDARTKARHDRRAVLMVTLLSTHQVPRSKKDNKSVLAVTLHKDGSILRSKSTMKNHEVGVPVTTFSGMLGGECRYQVSCQAA